MDIPRKYWWVIGIVIPILVAVVGIIPQFISKDEPSKPFYVEVVGTQFNGRVAFNSVTLVAEQTRQKLGTEMTEDVAEMLRKALKLAQAKNFTDAIPVFESVANAAPVPAVFNNLGAAYLATGNKEMAISSFEKALAIAPDEEIVRFNLEQAKPSDENGDSSTVQQIVRNIKEQPLSGSEEQEPNDTIFQANLFEVGHEVNAEISNAKDQDFFKFRYKAKLRDKITVSMESRSTTLRPHVKVYNKNKSEILARSNSTYGANLEFTLSVEPQSDHYLRVHPYDGSGQYRLTVVPQEAFDRHEPNDDQFSAAGMEMGQTIAANIMDAKDADWYRLTGINSEEVTVRMESRSTNLRPHVKVYNKDKSEILSRYNSTYGASLEFVFKAEPGSNYYLRVLPYDGQGKYQLSAR